MPGRFLFSFQRFRINRNIVECKFGQNAVLPAILPVLIETSWNVNR